MVAESATINRGGTEMCYGPPPNSLYYLICLDILEFLKNTDWDVCCLQEIMKGFHPEPHSDVAEYLIRSLNVEGHFVIAQSQDGGKRAQGNLILSRLPFKDTFSYYIQELNTDPNPRIAQAIQQDLAQIGIKAELHSVASSVVIAAGGEAEQAPMIWSGGMAWISRRIGCSYCQSRNDLRSWFLELSYW